MDSQLDILQSLIDALKTESRKNSVSPLRLATIHQILLDLIRTGAIADNYLSRIRDDRSTGKIATDVGFETGQFIAGVIGSMIDARGNAEFESVKARSFAQFAEIISNRQTAIEGDAMFTESDTIESVTDNHDGTYSLKLHEQWEGYYTAQCEHNVIRGIFNNIASSTPGLPGQTVANHAVCFTSWMNIISLDAAKNEITVILYPDAETPAGHNFPPEPMMKIARWGNSGDSSDPRYARRQTCFYLSSTEGRITKLRGVTKPIIDIGNIAATFGTLPELLASLDPRIQIGDDGIYVKTLAVQNFLKVDNLCRPVPTTVDVGPWEPGRKYSDGTTPTDTGEYERHLVWHLGHGWLCNTPHTSDASNAPAWNSTYWTHVAGDELLKLSLEGFPPAINPATFKIAGRIRATRGDIDVTGLIADADITWSRYSEDAQGNRRTASDNAWDARHTATAKEITLTTDDLDAQNGLPPVCIFKVTALLRDTPAAEPETLTASKGFGG